MNAQIARLFGLIVVLFGLLIVFTTRWTVIDKTSLDNNVLNHLTLIQELKIKRGRILADEHKQLDEECRFVAKQLNVALPDQPSAEQVGWMREFGPMKGHDFDVTAVKWLRVAHGGVFSAIASVRANTRNEMMRMFAPFSRASSIGLEAPASKALVCC